VAPAQAGGLQAQAGRGAAGAAEQKAHAEGGQARPLTEQAVLVGARTGGSVL
jgi:hypothetical protein